MSKLFHSKESTSIASSKRKNQKRTKTGKGNYTKIGRRFDGIVRTIGDDYLEYGLMEVAKSSRGGETATKWIDTTFKVAKALHDMMGHLAENVNCKEDVVRKLQLVGLINSGELLHYIYCMRTILNGRLFLNLGLKAQLVRMNCPKGYVCLLARGVPQEVPTSVDKLQALFPLMTIIWQMKVSAPPHPLPYRRQAENVLANHKGL